MFYMSSSFGLLGVAVESRDFSQAEKERTACKAEQIHKMTNIFTQNNNMGTILNKTSEFAQPIQYPCPQ